MIPRQPLPGLQTAGEHPLPEPVGHPAGGASQLLVHGSSSSTLENVERRVWHRSKDASGDSGGSVSGSLRIGVDIGGTFTDLCVLDDDGIVAVGKVLTTHDEPARAVEEVLREAVADHDLDPDAVGSLIHGTTLVTNALIERRGAPTALLTTEGFRDVLEMGREHRYELYDLAIEMPRPLVPRHLRHGVPERTLADGTVEQEVDVRHVQRLARELVDAGVEAVAVCFLHSHVDDRNERAARDAIAEVAPGLRVALSSEVNPEIREYERSSTTVANVYVQSIVERYLARPARPDGRGRRAAAAADHALQRRGRDARRRASPPDPDAGVGAGRGRARGRRVRRPAAGSRT